MKTLLVMVILGVCVVAWRGGDILGLLERIHPKPATKKVSIESLTAPQQEKTEPQQEKTEHRAMSSVEFIELSKTDPNAYAKFLASHQQPTEPGEIDKLMNFLAHGKYE